jgi:hypothetical protein
MYRFLVLAGRLLLPLLSPTLSSVPLKTSLTLLMPILMLVHTKVLWMLNLLACGTQRLQMNHELVLWDREVITQSSCRDLVSVSYFVFLPCTQLIMTLQVASSDQGFGGTPTDAHYYYQSIYGSQMCGFYKHVRSHAFTLAFADLTCD